MDINKKDLARMARLMYDLQQFCKELPSCQCPLRRKDCMLDINRRPENWDINLDDVVRLEKEANE